MAGIPIVGQREPPRLIGTDPVRLDLKLVHHRLSTEAYCAKGVPFDLIEHGFRRRRPMTRDAHGFYAQYGCTPLSSPQIAMEKHDPLIYRRGS